MEKNQHSLNIEKNPNSFITIYDTHAPMDAGLGVYFQGRSYKLQNPKDILFALKGIYARRGKRPRSIKEFLKIFPRRAYKFVPSKVWVNGGSDVNGNYIDVRTELDLEKLKKAFFKQK